MPFISSSYPRKIDLSKKLGRFKNGWRNSELILWLIPLSLTLLSSALIASTQRQSFYVTWHQHLITASCGLFVALLIAQLHIERLRQLLPYLYMATISSLVAVQLLGVSALGAQRWLSIGGVNIQPSEIAKIVVIITLASILEKQKFNTPLELFRPIAVIIIPWFLVFIQPDLGTSLVFGAILLVMLYWSGMPLEWALLFLSGVITAVLVGLFHWGLFIWIPYMGFLAYRSLPRKNISSFLTITLLSCLASITPWLWNNALKEYQRDRLILFLDPSKDPLGGGYHLIQSTIGIGSGGIFGTGLLNGQLTKLRFIPEQHTDFIFSALGEETGFLGTVLVSFGFFLLILRLLMISREAYTEFESLVVIGIATMIIFQVVVNIFMTIGLGPITGIPLPFMSYGRTSLIVSFMAIGLCISVSRRTKSFRS
ncbi:MULTISPECIES: rod shape-determining protein RodA [unclassified Prochlorococcus]|uniref:rod shape-determining protein RodA n=1 Tax=unclassified Prochlorococcus TaxID=2627481 RepID=UPI000533B9DC|nr:MULTISPECIES: rod shape-determining protein RodA [unclassified Prochlorococcus]KGG14653.1 Rod shape-determining protein RodA [Prochlorococcus sp. MIT 0602]KGG15917.1 Rod shape-determining protein RodA [Prochlorococcus sp. MIT 0603]